MAINFPNNPAVNDTFSVGGINFTFTGVKWESGAVVELSSDATPTLGGDLNAGAKNINNVGVITATGFSGPLTGNVTGNAQGLTGDPSIQVTNATVLGNLDVQGTTTTIDTAVTAVDSLAVDGSITALGNCGIGTDNPGYKLHVTGGAIDLNSSSTAFGDGVRVGKNIIGYSGQKLTISSQSNGIYLEGTSNSVIDLTSNGITFGNSSSGEIKFYPNTWTINNNPTITGSLNFASNIGIGTDNPISLLSLHQSGGGFEVNANSGSNNARLLSYDRSASAYREMTLQALSYGFETSGVEKLRLTGTSITSTVPFSDSLGELRQIPRLDKTTTYTITASDSGKAITADADITIPNNIMSVGDTITIIADGSGSISIIQDSGLVMYNSADGTTGNRTLGLRGMATIWFKHPSYAYISGSQLS